MRNPSANKLTPINKPPDTTPILPKGGSLVCFVAEVWYLAHSAYLAYVSADL